LIVNFSLALKLTRVFRGAHIIILLSHQVNTQNAIRVVSFVYEGVTVLIISPRCDINAAASITSIGVNILFLYTDWKE